MKEKNFKLTISFSGKDFYGWQRQKNKKTVQEEIEKVAEKIFKQKVKVIGCGRTDSGVHAINYVANLKVKTSMNEINVKNAFNSNLPSSIYIKDVKHVNNEFHSRYFSKRKTYRYIITLERTPFLEDFAFYLKEKTDTEKMKQAAKFFIGKHDFKAFCSAGTSVKNTQREIFSIDIKKEKTFIDENVEVIIIEIEGTGFLYKMVRNILGTLVYVGIGKIKVEDVKQLIEKKDRKIVPPPLPAKGLYFKNVEY